MRTLRDAADFDEIATQYDATREPLEGSALETIATTLRDWGVRSVLEVGVGTGRVAAPLAALGLEVTGVDASLGMLARARAKKVARLVRGTAYRLPFGDRTFDVGFFVHVLHLLEDPAGAIGEACRVGRLGAVALVRPPGSGPADGTEEWSARRIVLERLRQEGVTLPDRARGGPQARERELLGQFPPQRLAVVSEADVTEPLADQLAMFERRASRWTLRIPPETLAKAVAEARELVGDRTHSYHRVRALALWERPPRGSPSWGDRPHGTAGPGGPGGANGPGVGARVAGRAGPSP